MPPAPRILALMKSHALPPILSAKDVSCPTKTPTYLIYINIFTPTLPEKCNTLLKLIQIVLVLKVSAIDSYFDQIILVEEWLKKQPPRSQTLFGSCSNLPTTLPQRQSRALTRANLSYSPAEWSSAAVSPRTPGLATKGSSPGSVKSTFASRLQRPTGNITSPKAFRSGRSDRAEPLEVENSRRKLCPCKGSMDVRGWVLVCGSTKFVSLTILLQICDIFAFFGRTWVHDIFFEIETENCMPFKISRLRRRMTSGTHVCYTPVYITLYGSCKKCLPFSHFGPEQLVSKGYILHLILID